MHIQYYNGDGSPAKCDRAGVYRRCYYYWPITQLWYKVDRRSNKHLIPRELVPKPLLMVGLLLTP